MGIMTVSGSSCQASFHMSARLSPRKSSFRKPLTLVFKIDEGKSPNSSSQGTISMSMDAPKELKKSLRRIPKPSKTVKAVAIDEASPITTDLEYHEAAAQLENIYKLSPSHFSDRKDSNTPVQHQNQIRKKIHEHEKDKLDQDRIVVKNYRKTKRLDLNKRVLLKKRKERNITSFSNQVEEGESANRDVDKLVKEYSVSTDLYSWDWKKNKIPPVLSSSEQSWLFGLMQPMKALNLVKEELVKDLDRGPTLDEVAIATNMTIKELRKHLNVGQAARNKLIKHNLRLVIFVLNKYFQDFTNGQRFQDLCQAGVKGLIVSIDRFEYKRGFQLSTYAPFWIRHAIMRSMTLSNFTRVPFGLESVRAEVQKVKTQLSFELDRLPTEEEILVKVGISSERYNDVMGASKPVFSLNAKHIITNEEIVKGIADFDGAGDAKRRQTALFRLALDDVLDSLKPKENLVIRQRYGLDGKGDRTLSEIGGNLNISREMVRKHEMKALMKLKHPVRVDYLRKYLM